MDKLHFDDLTKITCPPGMLDDDTFLRLKTWPHGTEFWDGAKWQPARLQIARHQRSVYRARPAPLTQDVVPWHLLDDRLKVAVRHSDGVAHAVEDISVSPNAGFVLHGQRMRIDLLKGYQRGTVPWNDSLQKRPEGV